MQYFMNTTYNNQILEFLDFILFHRCGKVLNFATSLMKLISRLEDKALRIYSAVFSDDAKFQ